MSLLEYIDNPSSDILNFDLSPNINFYLIKTLSGATYNYNLPSITCDGQQYTLFRDDNGNSTVNLVGSLNINDILLSSYNISSYITVSVMSLGDRWYLIHASLPAQIGANNLISSFYSSNSSSSYLKVRDQVVFLIFPFLGTSSGVTINIVIVTCQGVYSEQFNLQFLNPSGSILFTLIFPSNTSTSTIYLTSSQKATLPTTPTPISVRMSTTLNNVLVGSILIY